MASTTKAIKKGEYVLINQELVTNGTFDSDTGWVKVNSAVIDGGALTLTTNSTTDSIAKQTVSTVVGEKYVVSLNKDIPGINPQALYVYIGTTDGAFDMLYSGAVGNTQGRYTDVFEALSETAYLRVISAYNGNDTITVDNVSIRRVSDVFRAKQDAPVGTALTDTLYFEDRTQLGVTSQALAYHSYNTLTNSYEGLKTEVLFSDVSKDDLLDNSTWMTRNGFSKVSDFLYSRGSELVLISNIVQI